MSGKCGGTSEVKIADESIQEIANLVKEEVFSKSARNFNKYEAKFYSSQVVAGINYFIKVEVDNGEYLHLRVYKHFSGTTELSNLLTGLTEKDPLNYF